MNDFSKGERRRLGHALERMTASIEAVRIALKSEGRIGPEAAQAIAHSGTDIAMIIARHDAYLFAQEAHEEGQTITPVVKQGETR